MTEWIKIYGVETLGVIFMLAFLYLEIRQKWTMWIVGIISSLFYVYINYQIHLFAIMGLMVYQTIVSFYGLYCWRFARTKNNENLKIVFIEKKLAVQLFLIGIPVFVGLFFLFNHINPANIWYINALDTLIATCSVIAAWMAARKIVESWYLWIFINPCNISVYIYNEKYQTALLYLVYAVFSIIGYIQWRKAALAQQN